MTYNKEKFCSQGCQEMFEETGGTCDFCLYYNFNGDENGHYTCDGFCQLHKEEREPYEGCDEFICGNINNK